MFGGWPYDNARVGDRERGRILDRREFRDLPLSLSSVRLGSAELLILLLQAF
jgi:hypothetical protein